MSRPFDHTLNALTDACQAIIEYSANKDNDISPNLIADLQRALVPLISNERMELAYQERVMRWIFECFGKEVATYRHERTHRFLEEALELVQSLNCSEPEVSQLVSYVYGRPKGDVNQELGGVMVTLAALCGVNNLNMTEMGEQELSRIWEKIDKIRERQSQKPIITP